MDPLTTLALSARDGNRLSLGAFIRQTQADVWRVCLRLGPREMAEDLTQEVYIRMMKALPSFRGESSAKTWLLGIARNTACDAMRSQRRRERLHDLLSSRAVAAEAADHSIEIHGLIDSLDHSQREALVLTQMLGLSYEEAAKICECPVGTIRSRVARARSNLLSEIDLRESAPPHVATLRGDE